MPLPRISRVRREIANALLIFLGVIAAGMGLNGFLMSSRFIDGGVTGVSMLLAQSTAVPLWVWLPLVNLPFLVLGYRHLGWAFALRGTIAIGALGATLAMVPYPDVTPDPLLTAVFGGFFIGAGIGLAVRGGAVLDGTEIAALLISRRTTLVKVGDVILIFNVALFLLAMTLLGVERALYSILTYMAAARTVDFVLYGLEEYTAMMIVSSESAPIREQLVDVLGRGVTVLKGYGGKSGVEQDVLYCVVTRLEVGKVKAIVRAFDGDAFVVSHALADVDGGVLKRRAHH